MMKSGGRERDRETERETGGRVWGGGGGARGERSNGRGITSKLLRINELTQ